MGKWTETANGAPCSVNIDDLLTCARALDYPGENAPAKHSAPGQYLGFALEPVRLCYHLLTAPKRAKVSLEVSDDIAVHFPGGAILLEQTKSALTQNPVSDWAT